MNAQPDQLARNVAGKENFLPMRKLLEWTPVGGLFTLADWLKALRHPTGWTGALLGLLGWLLWSLLHGLGEEPVVSALAAAFLGTLWWIWVSFGRANGSGGSIVAWCVGLTLFMVLAAPDEQHARWEGALMGFCLGSFLGAVLPTGWLRTRGRFQSLSSSRRRALALALPQIHLDDDDHPWTVISGLEPFQARQALADGWTIASPEGLCRMLEWLETQGHQQEMLDNLGRLESLKPGLRALLTSHRQKLETGGVAAWDLGRAVQLVRWGATARLLSLPEAWSHLKQLEEKAKSLYSSWEEYGQAYLLGSSYWCSREEMSENPFEASARWAMTHRKSPWRKLRW